MSELLYRCGEVPGRPNCATCGGSGHTYVETPKSAPGDRRWVIGPPCPDCPEGVMVQQREAAAREAAFREGADQGRRLGFREGFVAGYDAGVRAEPVTAEVIEQARADAEEMLREWQALPLPEVK